MHLDRRADVLADTLDSGRRRLASVEFGEIGESALAAARAALPDAWSRPKSPRRWPFVGALAVIGAAIAGWVFLVPTLRRPTLDTGPTGDQQDTGREALPAVHAEKLTA